MMLFDVIYAAEAESELIDVWLACASKQGFNHALSRIDEFLASNPGKHSYEVSEDLFAIAIPPVKAFYEIHEGDFVILVTGFRLIE
jgi:hypothetical protein